MCVVELMAMYLSLQTQVSKNIDHEEAEKGCAQV